MRSVHTALCVAMLSLCSGLGVALASAADGPTTQPEPSDFARRERLVHLSKGATQVTIPLQRASGFFVVPVRINDQDAGLFLVDTGSSNIVLARIFHPISEQML